MDPLSRTIVLAAAGATGTLATAHLARRWLRHRRGAAALAEAEERQLVPRSLHPAIDPDICIGSLSCLKACPEGDILEVVGGAAALVMPDHCIGHGRCAAECPVGAITLVFGTAKRGVDLPEVDRFFESSRPGVHVIGELAGMGLIKNAITQGLQVSERLAAGLGRGRARAPAGLVDVAVVGAGPAGLATALGLRQLGVSHRILEQDTVGGTIAHYPRQKVVMTEPVELPFYGRFGKRRISKEELLGSWTRAIEKGGLRVEERTKVTRIEGRDGDFAVATDRGVVRARKVVLAVGRRGTPRKLGVPGEDLEKVSYALVDPAQYDGRRLLVVGGGDAALEAAIQLAERGRAKVAISYRGPAFAKCREANRRAIEELARQGRVKPLMGSVVTAIERDRVLLALQGHEGRGVLKNDHVIACLGGELPLEFLSQAGVSLRRYFGEAPGAGARPDDQADVDRVRAERRARRRAALLYGLLGAAIVGFLAWKGWSYYLLPRLARLRSPAHALLRPAGAWGHGVGIVATAFMMSNFLYPLRKRSRLLMGRGSIRSWLGFHTFVGFMSPLVIAFHAAFQSNNLLATGTAAALLVVVGTGLFGRFVYGLVPSGAVKRSDLEARFERLRAGAAPLLAEARNRRPLEKLLEHLSTPARGGFLPALLFRVPLGTLRTRLRLAWARRQFRDRERFRAVAERILPLVRLRYQIAFFDSLKRLLGAWRVMHASLAGFLVLAIAAHIAVSLYLGYWLQ